MGKMQKESGMSRVEEARKKLALAQKKHAMLEVMALNQAKMMEFEEAKKRAMEAAIEAKRQLQEQRQKEKDALEETKKLIAEQKAKLKEARTAGKRTLAPVAVDGMVAPV